MVPGETQLTKFILSLISIWSSSGANIYIQIIYTTTSIHSYIVQAILNIYVDCKFTKAKKERQEKTSEKIQAHTHTKIAKIV